MQGFAYLFSMMKIDWPQEKMHSPKPAYARTKTQKSWWNFVQFGTGTEIQVPCR
jgi:hypothetical protein